MNWDCPKHSKTGSGVGPYLYPPIPFLILVFIVYRCKVLWHHAPQSGAAITSYNMEPFIANWTFHATPSAWPQDKFVPSEVVFCLIAQPMRSDLSSSHGKFQGGHNRGSRSRGPGSVKCRKYTRICIPTKPWQQIPWSRCMIQMSIDLGSNMILGW